MRNEWNRGHYSCQYPPDSESDLLHEQGLTFWPLPLIQQILCPPSDGPLPSTMQEVDLPIINNTMCESMYRDAGYVEHIPDIFICAGYAVGGKDSCEVCKVLIYELKVVRVMIMLMQEDVM